MDSKLTPLTKMELQETNGGLIVEVMLGIAVGILLGKLIKKIFA